MFFATPNILCLLGRVVSREYRINLSRSKIWEKTQVMILILKDTKRSEEIYVTEKKMIKNVNLFWDYLRFRWRLERYIQVMFLNHSIIISYNAETRNCFQKALSPYIYIT